MPSNVMLWKPNSKSDGRLIILTPNRYNNQIDQVFVVLPNGQRVAGRFDGNNHNGQRGHFRFDRPGSAFPQGSYVVMTLDDGGAVRWGIGNPGGRNEGRSGQPFETSSQAFSKTSGGTKTSDGNGGGGGTETSGETSGGSGTETSGETSGGSGTGPPKPEGDFDPYYDPNVFGETSSGSGNNVGYTDEGYAFPQADFNAEFTPINPNFIPNINVPFVDPLQATEDVAAFNQEKLQTALKQGIGNAQELVKAEFKGLEFFNKAARKLQQEGIIDENAFNQLQTALANDFNRTQIGPANEFNRGEISGANRFNQQERITQLEDALPGARDTILRQIDRGATLAEGRFVADAEDRAFEVASRNAAAEGTTVRGFGDDSVVGRRASDLLSAEQRLQVSQVGEQTLDRFLSLGANLAFDQPIKQNPILDQPLRFEPQQARTAQDVRGAPSVPASELAIRQQGALLDLTTLTPAQSINAQVGQNQFQANLDSTTNQFNSRLDFQAQQYNSSGALNLALAEMNAEVFNAQQEANAINAAIEAEQAQAAFDAGQGQGEDSAFEQILSTAGGIFLTEGIKYGFSLLKDEAAPTQTPSAQTPSGSGQQPGSSQQPTGQTQQQQATSSGAEVTGGDGAGSSEFALGTEQAIDTASGLTQDQPRGEGPQQTITEEAPSTTVTQQQIPRAQVSSQASSLSPEKQHAVNYGTNYAVQSAAEYAAATSTVEGAAVGGVATSGIAAGAAIATEVGLKFFDEEFGSSKSGNQQVRDQLRNFSANELDLTYEATAEQAARDPNIEEGHHYIQLADGSSFDIGLDGGHQWQNYGTNVDGGTTRNSFDIDWSDPRAEETVGYLNPLAFILYGDYANFMMGHLWNAATSNNQTLSETKENIRFWAEKAGLDYETGVSILKQYQETGALREHRDPKEVTSELDTRDVRAGGAGKQDFGTGPALTGDAYLSLLSGWGDLMLSYGVTNEIAA